MMKVLSSLWLKGSSGAAEEMLQVGQVLKEGDALYKRAMKEIHASRRITAEDYRKGKRGALVMCQSLADLESEPDPKNKNIDVGKGELVTISYSEPMIVPGLSLSELQGKNAVVSNGKVDKIEAAPVAEMPVEMPSESAAEPLQEVLLEDEAEATAEDSEVSLSPSSEPQLPAEPKKPGRKKST